MTLGGECFFSESDDVAEQGGSGLLADIADAADGEFNDFVGDC